jgi:hypothetical protein
MMKPMSQVQLLACTTLLLLGSASQSQADTIDISAGLLEMDGSQGSLELAGNRGFTLFSGVDVGDGVFFPYLQCVHACAPGSTVSLRAHWSGSDLTSFDATATLDGQSYSLGIGEDQASALVEFAGSVVLPALVGESAFVSAPFLFSGFFNPPDGPQETLRGRGTATLFIREAESVGVPGQWEYSSARYEFEPVPEPGTLLLVGGGLAAYAARVRRRRRTV